MEGKEANGGRVVAASPPRKKEIKNERRGADSQPPPKERTQEKEGESQDPLGKKETRKERRGRVQDPSRNKERMSELPGPQKERNPERKAGGEPGHPLERYKGGVDCQGPHRKKLQRTEGKGRARPPP